MSRKSRLDASFYLSRLLPFDPLTTRIWKFPILDASIDTRDLTLQIFEFFKGYGADLHDAATGGTRKTIVEDVLHILQVIGLVNVDDTSEFSASQPLQMALDGKLDFSSLFQAALLAFQYPCPYPIKEFLDLDRGMTIKPFLTLSELLHDPDLDYHLKKQEIRIVLSYGNNIPSIDICKERILDFRNTGKWKILRNYKYEFYDLNFNLSPNELILRIDNHAVNFWNLLITSQIGIESSESTLTFNNELEPLYGLALKKKDKFILHADAEVFRNIHEARLFSLLRDYVIGYQLGYQTTDSNDPDSIDLGTETEKLETIEEDAKHATVTTHRKAGYPQRKSRQFVAINDIVQKYHPEGINLNNPEDLVNLAIILQREYPTVNFAKDQDGLKRICRRQLIDWGDNTFISLESIRYTESLMDEVVEYIKNSPQPSMYFSSLFDEFRGRFKFQTNIQNPAGLKSLLQILYPDEFDYGNLQVSKVGEHAGSFSSEFERLVRSTGGPISRAVIIEQLFGGDSNVFSSEMRKAQDVIKWGDTTYHHVACLEYATELKTKLQNILDEQIRKYDGFTSMKVLYDACSKQYGSELSLLHINSEIELFNFSQYAFGSEYRFSQPNIYQSGLPYTTIPEAIQARFAERPFEFEEVMSYGEFFSWSAMSITNGITGMLAQESHKRISEQQYIPHILFLDKYSMHIDAVNKRLEKEFVDTRYVLSSSLIPFDQFPAFGLAWNEYLLESFLSLQGSEFRSIAVDKENSLSYFYLIVRNDSQIFDYDQLVLTQIKQKAIRTISESEFEEFLLDMGLTEATIPRELKKSHLMQNRGKYWSFSW